MPPPPPFSTTTTTAAAAARPLAPQPPGPTTNAPVLQPLQNTHSLKTTRARRGAAINAACHECRSKKLKCDGARPLCRRCVERGHRVCEYTVNPGETRFTALKRKNAKLITEAERMQSFIHTLRAATPSQIQTMLDDYQATIDHPALLHDTPQPTPMSDSPRPLLHHDSDSSVSSAPHSRPSASVDTSDTPHTSRSRSSVLPSADSFCLPTEYQDLTTKLPYQPFDDLETQLPTTSALRDCIGGFDAQAGKLFHIFTPEDIEAQFLVLSTRQDSQARCLAACQLCAIGAIGSQYIRDSVPEDTERKMYNVAKHLLEDVVTTDATRAAKICAMLAMFNVMSKEKVAMTFVEMGLNLLAWPPITQVCPPNMKRSQWVELRKTWRLLVFLETWLSSTLGYVSGSQLQKELINLKNFEIEGEADFEERVTTEMIKIVVLKFDMLRLSLAFNRLSTLTIETITKDLQAWYQALPDEMYLPNLERDLEISPKLRVTIYYVHFLYFGSQIMLLRRVLQSINEQSKLLNGSEAAVNDLIRQAKYAARESAKLFRRLYVDGNIIKRCWVCIFQAYSSCILILHDMAQELMYEQHTVEERTADLNQDMHLALACLDLLKVCAVKDVAAGQFLQTLTPFYKTLHAAATGKGEVGAQVFATAHALHDLFRAPFKTPFEDSTDSRYLWKQQQQQRQQEFESFPLSGLPNALSPSLCCDDSWQRIDGIKNDGMVNDLLSAIRPGHFLPGFESNTWNDGTQDVLMSLNQSRAIGSS